MVIPGPSPGLASYQARWQAATCVITREDPDAEPVLDPETGQLVDPPPTEVYDGPCLVLPVGADRVVQFGDGPTSLRQYELVLKGLSEEVHVGDTATVSSDRDPQLDGLELVVLDVPKSSLPTNRRLVAEEVIA